MRRGILIPRNPSEDVWEVSIEGDLLKECLLGDPLPVPIGRLNLSMVTDGPIPGYRRWPNLRASCLAWFLNGGAMVPIRGDAVLVSDEIRGEAVPEPLRSRVLGRGGPYRIHYALREGGPWYSQREVYYDYFEAIDEAVDLNRDAIGTIKHIHISRADEVLLW